MNRLLVTLTVLALAAAPASALGWNSMSTGGNPLAWNSGNPETTWHLSSNFGSSSLGQTTVVNVLEDAINEWGVPGCTNFNAAYGGTRSGNPTLGSQNEDLVGFLQTGWPAAWGSTTLAVTSPAFWADGEIIEASMTFNEVNYDWVTNSPGNWDQADLQSVAAHEFGHWIGFDHSNFTGSSMTAFYSGGTAERTLTCDDTEGVCWKYASSGNSCTATRYCECGVTCSGGLCNGDPGDDDDATPPDDDDDDEVQICGTGLEESFNESEPNDWQAEDDIDYATPGAGDLRITGSITCGNDGNVWTADYDWFVIDFPCVGDARYTLDWSGTNSDLDFYVWAAGYDADGDGELDPYVTSLTAELKGPIYAEAAGGGRMWVLVLCWEGSDTTYDFTFDWSPFVGGGDDDDESWWNDKDKDKDKK
jgi:hypothetical protein